jgi:hypothetical protein
MQPEADRVRAHSPQKANDKIDGRAEDAVRAYAGRGAGEIAARADALGREWDMERVLQANAAVVALAGIGLGAAVSKRWLALPGIVFSFFAQHAIQGWCPPVALFRRLGVRTRREINAERYALKALRGDFDAVPPR